MPKDNRVFQTLPKGFQITTEAPSSRKTPASPTDSTGSLVTREKTGSLSPLGLDGIGRRQTLPVSNTNAIDNNDKNRLHLGNVKKTRRFSATPTECSAVLENMAPPLTPRGMSVPLEKSMRRKRNSMSLRHSLQLSSMDSLDDREAVRVVVRCRPFIPQDGGEAAKAGSCIHTYTESKTIFLKHKKESRQYTFDNVFGMESTQKEVLASALPIVDMALGGLNGTIFAYGQTSSGKTHTMMGNLHGGPDEQGIIPSVVDYMFEQMKKPSEEHTKYLLMVSFLEIYNEHVRDLLGEDSEASLDVRQAPDLSFHVPDLSRHLVSNRRDLMRLIIKGNKIRTTSATKKNENCSRSHSVLSIHIEKSTILYDRASVVSAKLNLVDLAGSERLCDIALSDKKETVAINQSLTCLANVISALTSSNPNIFVPYRDSKLTKLLKDSLGGNAKTLMIACVNPSSTNAPETLSTLRYASRAKKIRNKPIVNKIAKDKDALMYQLQQEIEELKRSLNEKEQSQQAMLSMVKELGIVLEGEEDATNAEDRLNFLNSFIHTVPKCARNAAALWHRKTFKSDKLMVKLQQMEDDSFKNGDHREIQSASVQDLHRSATTTTMGSESDGIEVAKEMLHRFQKEMNQAKKTASKYKQKDDQVKHLMDKIEALRSENRILSRHSLDQEYMNDMLRERLQKLQIEKKKLLESTEESEKQREMLENVISTKKNEYQALEETCAGLEREKWEMENQIQEKDILIDQKNNEYQDLVERCKMLEAAATEANREREQQNGRIRETGRIHQTLKEKYLALEMENQKLKREMDSKDKVIQEKEHRYQALEEKCSGFESENAELKQRLAEKEEWMKEKIEECQAHEKQRREAEADSRTVKAQVEEYERRIHQMDGEYAQLEERSRCLEANNQSLQKKLQEKEDRICSLEAEIHEMQEQCQRLENDLSHAGVDIQTLFEAKGKVERELADQKHLTENADQTAKDRYEETIQRLEDKVRHLTEECGKLQGTEEKLIMKEEEWQRKESQWEHELHEMSRQYDDLIRSNAMSQVTHYW